MEMAQEAEFELDCVSLEWHKRIEAFAKLVLEEATAEANARANASWTLMCKKMVAAEREACAKLCDELANDENTDEYINAADWCAVRIRARGNHD
jgi:hypothetical protein